MTRAGQEAYVEAVAAQQRASDPDVSAFVDANAGAGKTAVLTARVARLLLAGAAPAKVLCITYTRAAAAEMAARLLKLLGEWALADDRRLSESLNELEGAPGKARSAGELARARGLFARALETPGGLKIQTIHSFCETVLRRFPLETGAGPGFSVLDETESSALARAALRAVSAMAVEDPAVGDSLDRLMRLQEPDKIALLLIGQLLSRQKLGDALAHAGGWAALKNDCPRRFDVAADDTPDSIRDAALAAIGDAAVARLQAAFRAGAKVCQGYASDELAEFLTPNVSTDRFALLVRVFLKADGQSRTNKFPDAGVKAAHPWAEQSCRDLSARLQAAVERAHAAGNCADTIALLTLLEEASGAYARLKQARAGIDYDDLISKTRALFRSGRNAWVQYKLDQGVDHILLDEGQDTSPAQWDVIEGPLQEFIAGEGARAGPRTFFAVGDKKQSIYSFQGADAALFDEKMQDLGKTLGASQRFTNEPLRLSFRSTAPVLSFVDALFDHEEAREGVTIGGPLRHEVRRVGQAGSVELWPLTPKADKEKARAWDAPLDMISEDNPARRLTRALAADIRRRIGAGTLASKGRAFEPRDFLILVQSRGALFHEMIRALARAGVPVAGADRVRLLEEAAVDDVLSFARAVLLWTDDLSLAETLRGPFCDLDEQSLHDLACGREEPLRAVLRRRAPERAEWGRAEAAIARAERVGREEGAFAFISHLLETGDPSGRKRLYGRLSPSAEEPLNELLRQALGYEQNHARSLQGFLNWAERNAVEIKRDPDQSGDAARVMTVHGAKGLEAPVVILLDAHRGPNLTQLGPLFFGGARGALFPVVSSSGKGEGALAAAVRSDARRKAYEEYRRLLYVAATRACDHLVVCGVELGNAGDPHGKPVAEKTWHALAEDAFGRLRARDDRDAPWGGAIRIIDCPQEVDVEVKEQSADKIPPPPPPAWLFAPAAREGRRRLAPSALAGDGGPVYSPLRPNDRMTRGKALHRLIELLPQIPDAARASAADRLLARSAAHIPEAERGRWRDEALLVVRDGAFAPVFAEGSRAEVAIAGKVSAAGGETFVSGKIDRLALAGDRLLIVDYKTNRPPPKRIEDVPEAYVAQLAAYRSLLRDIYPGARLEAALLWTYEARLTPIPQEMLDAAFERFIAAA